MYQTMHAAIPVVPKNKISKMQIKRKIKQTLFSFQDKLLSFRENIGISDINNHENRQTKNSK